MRLVVAFIAGGIFGLGLVLAGMTDTAKVRGFLDFFGAWDPTLVFVMGGAIIPMFFAWRYAQKRTSAVLGSALPGPPKAGLDRVLITGALLFGAGWGLAGFCPGPALASLSFSGSGGLLFVVAMIAGMGLSPPVRRALSQS